MVEKGVMVILVILIMHINLLKKEAESTCKRPQDTAYECDY
jgi:hypothetical protein